jgi:hypothetical protein
MFDRNKDERLDRLIASLEDDMLGQDPASTDYTKKVVMLDRLYEMKAKNRPSRVSRDTLITVAGNLAAVLIIVLVERDGIITSKAFQPSFLKNK